MRLGYAFDRTLIFAKAGAVYSGAKMGYRDHCTVLPCGNTTLDMDEKLGFGYQLGLGLEHALSEKWTVKAEYSYLDFGRVRAHGIGVDGVGAQLPYSSTADISSHTVRVGLNYRF